MKNFYEILGIESGASKEEIKRAYFKLVRKYPPDRYEKEFMEIREAYETLSNENTRKQYDSINFLPADIKAAYDSARELIEEYDDLDAAIKILEKILKTNPELLIVKSLLGETCLNNSNTGKAVKVYEELTAAEPENAAFAGYLANAYLGRGWQKKAIAAYNRAIELDSDNISLWIGLSDAYGSNRQYFEAKEILEKAANRGSDSGDSTTIYLRLIMLDISFRKLDSINKYLDRLTELAANNIDIKDNVAWTLSHIANLLMRIDRTEEAEKVITAAMEILPEEEYIVQTQKEIESFNKYGKELERLDQDKTMEMEVTGLIMLELLPEDELDMDKREREAMIYFHEYRIVQEYNKLKSSIKKLKNKYPKLYAVKSSFFERAENGIERKKMEFYYEKNMKKHSYILNRLSNFEEEDDFNEDWYDEDWEAQEPFMREEPKVGRNDPCPCGSGKKYKKCCGK